MRLVCSFVSVRSSFRFICSSFVAGAYVISDDVTFIATGFVLRLFRHPWRSYGIFVSSFELCGSVCTS